MDRQQCDGAVRTWTPTELARAQTMAMELGQEIYAAVFCLARYTGRRLHECFWINTHDAELALKTGTLIITGKGGLRRTISSTPEIDMELRKLLDVMPPWPKAVRRPPPQDAFGYAALPL